MTNIITGQEMETLSKLTERSQYYTALGMLEGIFNGQTQNVSSKPKQRAIISQISEEMTNADPLFNDLMDKFDERMHNKIDPLPLPII